MKQPVPATEPIVPEPIVLECDLPQPPALVWRALTEKELLAAWLLPNDLRAEVGARFTFAPSIDCEVLAVEPNRTLRWRQTESGDAASGWQPVTSVVTIQLTDNTAGGTHLRLVHDEFAIVASVATVSAVASVSAVAAVPAAAARVIPFKRRSTESKRSVSSILAGPDIVCQLRRAA